jgi:hypothetical protein
MAGEVSSAPGPAWHLWVRGRPVDPTSAWGTRNDINGDGFVDIIDADFSLSNHGGTLWLGGPFGVDASNPVVFRPNPIDYGGAAGIGDFNGDGFGDIAWVEIPTLNDLGSASIPFKLVVRFGGPQGLTTTGLSTYAAGISSPYPAGDLNGDGYADFAMDTHETSGGIGLTIVYGSPTSITPVNGVAFSSTMSSLGTVNLTAGDGDIDGDGFADLAAQLSLSSISPTHVSGPDGGVQILLPPFWVARGRPTGIGMTPDQTIALPPWSWPGAGGIPMLVGSGDVTGDGFPDVAVGAQCTGSPWPFFVYPGSATGLTAASAAVTEIGCTMLGDFDGDGFDDLVATAPGGLDVHRGEATGFASAAILAGTATMHPTYTTTAPKLAGTPGDVNGDGIDDLVVRHPVTSKYMLYFGGPAGLAKDAPDQTW